jgi:hypothetical protein
MWSLGMNNIAIQFELNLDLVELNSNSTKFNSIIGVRFNWRQMGCKLVEKDFETLLWIWCWKIKIKHKFEITPFHVSLLGNGLNKFQFDTIQCTMIYKTWSCPT